MAGDLSSSSELEIMTPSPDIRNDPSKDLVACNNKPTGSSADGEELLSVVFQGLLAIEGEPMSPCMHLKPSMHSCNLSYAFILQLPAGKYHFYS